MHNTNYFKDLLNTIPAFEKFVTLMFLIKTDVVLSQDCGFLRNGINGHCRESEKFLKKQNEEELDYLKRKKNQIWKEVLLTEREFTLSLFLNSINGTKLCYQI